MLTVKEALSSDWQQTKLRLPQNLRLRAGRRLAEVEIVTTGRSVPPELVALANLVTEMRPERHYYEPVVPARRGLGW